MNINLSAVAGRKMQSPNRIAVVSRENLQKWNLQTPAQLLISRGKRRVTVWLCDGDVEDLAASKGDLPPDLSKAIVLSKRSRDALEVTGPSDVRVSIPESVRLKTFPALIDDLPRGDEVQVSKGVFDRICARHSWALMIYGGCVLPVRLQTRKMTNTNVRLSMLTRALICSEKSVEDFQEVLLCAMIGDNRGQFSTEDLHAWKRLSNGVQRLVSAVLWWINCGIEWVSRPLIGAPSVVLRTTEALVGDDNDQVVRLHRDVLPLIGVKSGDHVVITWAERQVMAVALESNQPKPGEIAMLRKLKRVDLIGEDFGSPAFDHLSIGVSARLRAELGIPRNTSLRVRRRIVTVLLAQLNQLTIPVIGLLLAAVVIPDVSVYVIIAGLFPVVIIGLLPIRHRKPPVRRL